MKVFTNISLAETINLAVDVIFKSNLNLKISKKDLKTLFEFATKDTHFSFDGDLYDQIDGVAMGSPLAPALANLFMSHYETKWLQNEKASDVVHHKRYVDDIFCLFKTEIEVEEFYSFINCQHPNTKFTLEKEHKKTLPFSGILVNSNENKIETSAYYKKTYTGLLTYYFSFTRAVYKSSLVRTLVDRTFKINSSWKTFHLDLKRIKENLQRNFFPINFIDSRVKCYLDHKIGDTKNKKSEKTSRYFKLPYIGRYSDYTNKKLVKIVENLCKENIRKN